MPRVVRRSRWLADGRVQEDLSLGSPGRQGRDLPVQLTRRMPLAVVHPSTRRSPVVNAALPVRAQVADRLLPDLVTKVVPAQVVDPNGPQEASLRPVHASETQLVRRRLQPTPQPRK